MIPLFIVSSHRDCVLRKLHKMLKKLILSGTAFVGGVMCAATADEPASPEPVQESRTQAALQVQPGDVTAQSNNHSIELPPKETAGTPQSERKQSPDEAAIRLVDESFVRAYEAGDAQSVAAHFTNDAEYVDEKGAVFAGRDAIERCLTEFFAENPECTLQINADSVRTISPGVVVQDGFTSVTRSNSPAPVQCHSTTVYVNTDGKWLVASIRDSIPRDLCEHSVHLQQLNWLKGDWVDEGDDAIVNFSCEAVDNGNFLLRRFTIVIGGEEAMSGTQRIGWDPVSGKLRTWIFDSEGAYAEGLWHRDEDNNRWVLKTTGVMSDGQTASGTSLYTFVNDHTMTWQCVNYEISGLQQPDSQVITIVRHSPSPTPVAAADLPQ